MTFTNLYHNLKAYKRKAPLSYVDLIAMFRYFRRIARRTMLAIAIQVQECTGRQCNLWKINALKPEYREKLLWVARKEALDKLEQQEDDLQVTT